MELEEENVVGATVEYEDNSALLASFMGKPFGLFALLDEESKFPRASESTLIGQFHHQITSQLAVNITASYLQKNLLSI